MTNDKALEASLKAADPLLFSDDAPTSHMAASPVRVDVARDLVRSSFKAAISAYLSALPGEAEVVMEHIAHKEQIGIWANEITSALSLSDFLREDWSFDDSVDLEKEVAAQLLDIIRSAITHPGLNLVASLQALQARAESAERERDYWQKLHDERTAFLGQCATEKEAAEARVKELEEEVEAARDDKARLDYLDSLNAALNAHHGTSYKWLMVVNHNVNRVMFNFPRGADLSDSHPRGFGSCRQAIDQRMLETAAFRIARTALKGGSNG